MTPPKFEAAPAQHARSTVEPTRSMGVRVWPAGASAALRDVLLGPAQPARVLAAFPTAVYLLRGDSAGVVAAVTADGVRLPNAVVMGATSDERPFGGVRVGAHVRLGDGLVSTGHSVLAVARWFDPRPRTGVMRPGLAGRIASLAAALAADPHEGGAHAAALTSATGALTSAMDLRDPNAVAVAAHGLLGLGPGLTPAGDDLLAGTLAAGRLLAPAAAGLLDALSEAVRSRRDRTTALSSTLLDHAARGEVAEPAGEMCRALAGNARLSVALERLLAVGHTSGYDLAQGLLVGARLAASLPGPLLARSPGALGSREAPSARPATPARA